MNRLWILFAISLLFVHSSTKYLIGNRQSCVVDYHNKSATVHNLKYNCNQNELKSIFQRSPAGRFPPIGMLNGWILVDGLQNQNIWNGKRIKRRSGHPPHDHGTLTNMLYHKFEMFNADIYRARAPIDGQKAFVLNYRHDRLAPYMVDYIREVQANLYLGIVTIRTYEKDPLCYFALEKAEFFVGNS